MWFHRVSSAFNLPVHVINTWQMCAMWLPRLVQFIHVILHRNHSIFCYNYLLFPLSFQRKMSVWVRICLFLFFFVVSFSIATKAFKHSSVFFFRIEKMNDGNLWVQYTHTNTFMSRMDAFVHFNFKRWVCFAVERTVWMRVISIYIVQS